MNAPGPPRPPPAGPLFLDLYELTMADAYLAEGIADLPATFSLVTRRLPPGWSHLVSAGLADVLAYLEGLRFDDEALARIAALGVVSDRLLDRLAGLRFSGGVRAVPEGTPFTADAPLLEVTAPLLEAQLVEGAVVNLSQFAALVAAKASRCVEAARGRPVVDFSLRRAHGRDAALTVARAAWIAGFAATSNVEAGAVLGIPVMGTMAHSYVQAHRDEPTAFATWLSARAGPQVLLVDTYDTLCGVAAAIRVTRADPGRLAGVRLDSGDLAELAHAARAMLDAAGRGGATILVSGGLDEHAIAGLLASGSPVDAFAVGTRLAVVADSPGLDMAYKLVEFAGEPTMKLSAGKATRPGASQVWRTRDGDRWEDVIGLAGEPGPPGGEPLLVEAMRAGRTLLDEDLADARRRCAAARRDLPRVHRGLHSEPLPRRVSDAAAAVRARVAASLRAESVPLLPGS